MTRIAFINNFWKFYNKTSLSTIAVYYHKLYFDLRATVFFEDIDTDGLFVDTVTHTSISLAFFELIHELGNEFKYRVQYDLLIFSVITAPIILLIYICRKIYYWLLKQIVTRRLSIRPVWLAFLLCEIGKILIVLAIIHIGVGLTWIGWWLYVKTPFLLSTTGSITISSTSNPLLRAILLWLYEGGAHITRSPLMTFVSVFGTALEYSFIFLIAALVCFLLTRLYRHAIKNVYFGIEDEFRWHFWFTDILSCIICMTYIFSQSHRTTISLRKRYYINWYWPRRFKRKQMALEEHVGADPITDHFERRFDMEDDTWNEIEEWTMKHQRWKVLARYRRSMRHMYKKLHSESTLWYILTCRKLRRRLRYRRRRRLKKIKRRRKWYMDMDWEIIDDMPINIG